MRRMRPVRGEPAMVISDQQARFGRERGCRPLERSVVGDLQDLLSEPNPLPQQICCDAQQLSLNDVIRC
jgi:hypothetical protein